MRKTMSLAVAAATMATALIPGTSQAEPSNELNWDACPADVSPGLPGPSAALGYPAVRVLAGLDRATRSYQRPRSG